MLREKKYVVDTDTGEVHNKHGKKLTPFYSNHKSSSDHQFVYLFRNGNERRGIAVHRLCWMAATDSLIPSGWEIHHRDQNPLNNSWFNLLCLHPEDHKKVHATKDVPF